MSEKTSNGNGKILAFKAAAGRFPKVAVDFIDTLLSVQRARFEKELSNSAKPADLRSLPVRPSSAHILAESDQFIGSGWSSLGKRRDGTCFRWMGRLGTMMLSIDLSKEATFSLYGCGFTKRRFLKEATLWIEDQPVPYKLIRKGFNRWYMEGVLPVMPERPYYILRIQSPGMARLAEGVDAYVSLAVTELKINC